MNAPDRMAWLVARQSGVGGSDVAAILGLSKWATPYDVWLSKTQPIVPEAARPANEPMLWGTLLEDVVAREYARRSGNTVQRVRSQMRDPAKPWKTANIDRAIVKPGSRARIDAKSGRLLGAAALLEVKTASAYSEDEWVDAETGATTVPLYYQCQGLWYLDVCELDLCDFAALIGGQQYRSAPVERDDEVIAWIDNEVSEFWHRYVLTKTPPPPSNSRDAERMFRRDDGTLVEIGGNETLLTIVADLRVERERMKGSEKLIEDMVETLKLAIGPASGLKLDGKPVVTWKAAKDTTDTDWCAVVDALRAEVTGEAVALAIAKHTTTTPGSRRFLVKK